MPQPRRQQGPGRLEFQVRLKFLGDARLVGERVLLGFGLEEEVERIDDRHLGDEIDLRRELAGLLREDDPGEVVAERILLPVEEMPGRVDAQRVAQDRRAAVRRRPQPDDLRPQRRRAVVAVRVSWFSATWMDMDAMLRHCTAFAANEPGLR